MPKLWIRINGEISVSFDDCKSPDTPAPIELLRACKSDSKKLFKVLVEKYEGRDASFKELEVYLSGEVRQALKDLLDTVWPELDAQEKGRGQLYTLVLPYGVTEEDALLCIKKTGRSSLRLTIKRGSPMFGWTNGQKQPRRYQITCLIQPVPSLDVQ